MTHRTPGLKGQVDILHSTLVAKGLACTRSFAHELVAKLNGYASWNVAARSSSGAQSTQVEPIPRTSSLVSAFEINMVDLFPDYDTPDEVAAWDWVKAHAAFAHVDNGIGAGVWEFLVLCSTLRFDSSHVPSELKAAVQEGLNTDAKWLVFYQFA
jgi:hypothetical protein